MIAQRAITLAVSGSVSHTWMPGTGLRFVSMTVAGRRASIHLLPCRAEAEKPATTPRRRVRSHPALARRIGVSSVPVDT